MTIPGWANVAEMRLRLGVRAASALLLASALCAAACQEQATAPKGPREVGVFEVKVQDIPIFTDFVGTIDGVENAEIRARVAGYLEAASYKEGAPVKKGDLLFTIDPVLSQAAVRKASGDLAMARAKAQEAKADAERYKELFATNSASVQEFDQAQARKGATEADVLAMQGSLETAQANLKYTKVTSPIDGIAGVRNVSIGSLVGQGEPTLLTTVSSLDTVRVRFPISEQQYIEHAEKLNTLPSLDATRPGNLELILADGSTYPHKGRLTLIDRAIKASLGSIMLEARFPNPDLLLRPGQFARVRVMSDKLDNAIAVPQRAVVERQSLQQVYVVKPDQSVEVRAVQLGPRVGSYWVVLKGLAAGDKVIVEGQQKVKPGDKVTAKPMDLKGLVAPPPVPSGLPSPPAAPAASESATPAPAASR